MPATISDDYSVKLDGATVAQGGSLEEALLLWGAILFIYNLKYRSARRLGVFLGFTVLQVEERALNDPVSKKVAAIVARVI